MDYKIFRDDTWITFLPISNKAKSVFNYSITNRTRIYLDYAKAVGYNGGISLPQNIAKYTLVYKNFKKLKLIKVAL